MSLFLLSGCAQSAGSGAGTQSSTTAPGSSAVPGDDDALMLRVEQTGGFVGPDMLAGRMPQISVYADGRVIFDGPVPAVYPGPALPNVQVVTISPDALGTLIDKAVAAGVEEGADFGHPGVADAPTTEITVRTVAGEQTVAAEALNEAQADDPMLTAPQKQARKKLLAFTEELNRLTSQPAGGTPQQYRPETLAAIVRPYVEPGDGLPERPKAVVWPGPALPGESLNPAVGLGCVAATGKQLDAVLAAAKDANAATPWTSGGDAYSLRLRPLLPDETGCADLKAAR
ncbi:hypothetical protein ACFQFC_40590 [Amorphoplanes digitatis]|uniref:Uncharacterized protein n=1 Tax=Actinoplanes digitatis TaxID=1868 RepID=A0A7W7MPU9_9ACTN|nr:hypothetical protein [Actinoplanes digitatis]MBB4762473.1 hypothetical protein [Actinoplanes digitatis]